jgi:hypothetical protein
MNKNGIANIFKKGLRIKSDYRCLIMKENGPKRQETIRPSIKAKMKMNKKKGRVIGIKMSVMNSEQHTSLGKRST